MSVAGKIRRRHVASPSLRLASLRAAGGGLYRSVHAERRAEQGKPGEAQESSSRKAQLVVRREDGKGSNSTQAMKTGGVVEIPRIGSSSNGKAGFLSDLLSGDSVEKPPSTLPRCITNSLISEARRGRGCLGCHPPRHVRFAQCP